MYLLNTYYLKTLIALFPIIIITGFFAINYNKTIRDEQRISERYNKLNANFTQKEISKNIKKIEKKEKNNLFSGLLAKMRLFGIDLDIQKLTIFCIIGYTVFALLSYFLIGAGPLLMLYVGAIFIALVYIFLSSKIDKRKRELKDEFMNIIRDVASQMSVGLNFTVAVEQSIKDSQVSGVMIREFDRVSNSIYTGKSMSEAFTEMYNRLKIEEIREFSSVLEIFEITGGKLSDFIKSFNDTYTAKMKVQNEKDIFIASLKSSQKFIIGVPVFIILAFSFIAPNVMKGYYASIQGQIVGIVLITVIIFGAVFSIKFVEKGGKMQ